MIVRRLVTLLEYKVDRSGLREYRRAAEHAAKSVRESISGARNAQSRLNSEQAETVRTIQRMSAAMRVFLRRLDEAITKAVELRMVLGKVTQTILRSARGTKIFANASGQAAADWRKVSAVTRKSAAHISYMEKKMRSMMMLAGAVAGAVGGIAAVAGAFQADRWIRSRAQLRAVMGENAQAEMQQVEAIAGATGQRVVPVADVYRRLVRSQGEQTGQITELLTKAVVAGGGRLSEKQSRVEDIAQALAKGVFDSSDVKNLFEDMPLIARIMADAYGIKPGDLVQRAEQAEDTALGGLDATKFIDELISRSDELNRQLSRMPDQFRFGINILLGAFGDFADRLNRVWGISNKFVALSRALANNIGTIFKQLMLIGTTGIVGALGLFFRKYGKYMLPFLRMWIKVYAMVYAVWLVGQDILVWLRGIAAA